VSPGAEGTPLVEGLSSDAPIARCPEIVVNEKMRWLDLLSIGNAAPLRVSIASGLDALSARAGAHPPPRFMIDETTLFF
jgi:hypothetical protein